MDEANKRDEQWRRYVAAYDIEVSQESIAEEERLIELDLRHRMQYDHMSEGAFHPFPDAEIEQQREAIHEAALFEAKEPLVLREIIQRQSITAYPDELLSEAQAIADRHGETLDSLRRFFGDDFALLSRDICNRKAIDWALSSD